MTASERRLRCSCGSCDISRRTNGGFRDGIQILVSLFLDGAGCVDGGVIVGP